MPSIQPVVMQVLKHLPKVRPSGHSQWVIVSDDLTAPAMRGRKEREA